MKVAEQTTVDYAGGVLRIEAKSKVLGNTGSIEVTVQLPAGSRVDAKAAAADFRGVGRFGDVTFEGAQSSIKIDEASNGAVTLSTQSGDVSIGAAAGVSASLDVGTYYGRIHNSLKNIGVAGLTIRATTAHGDIAVRSGLT